MNNYDYYAPETLGEALSLLDRLKNGVRMLAGGTDLIVQMKAGRMLPSALVDAKHVPELNKLEMGKDGSLLIGAAVPLSRIVAFPPVKQKFEMLYQGCSLIGSVQIRNRATIGGNICNAAPSADSVPPLLCLKAQAVITSSQGARTLPLENFFRGPGICALTPGELLQEIQIPAPLANSSGCYLRHTPRQEMDIAVVGVGSWLRFDQSGRCDEARIVLGAVAPTPLRVPDAEAVLIGKNIDDNLIQEAAVIAAQAAKPISDLRASIEYRREIVKVLTRRTIKAAATSGRA